MNESRITARMPMLPSSFYCGALSFDSYGTQSYVLKQKGPKCVMLKPQTSLESESLLALFDPDASRHSASHVICSSLRMQICFVQLHSKTTINKGEDDE